MRYAAIIGIVLLANPAWAETWSAVAKIEIGPCTGGLVANVTENPGTISLKFSQNGKDIGVPWIINLAPDGSGKGDFVTALAGPITFTVSAGTGKRAMSSIQKQGQCRWSWH